MINLVIRWIKIFCKTFSKFWVASFNSFLRNAPFSSPLKHPENLRWIKTFSRMIKRFSHTSKQNQKENIGKNTFYFFIFLILLNIFFFILVSNQYKINQYFWRKSLCYGFGITLFNQFDNNRVLNTTITFIVLSKRLDDTLFLYWLSCSKIWWKKKLYIFRNAKFTWYWHEDLLSWYYTSPL